MKKMLVSLVVLTTANFLVGCSSTQLVQNDPPYCYTDETIIVENGQTVNSKTKLDCTDKPRVEHFVKDVGIAKTCRPYQQTVSIKGKYKNVQGFLCQFDDGSWQAVDGSYAY